MYAGSCFSQCVPPKIITFVDAFSFSFPIFFRRTAFSGILFHRLYAGPVPYSKLWNIHTYYKSGPAKRKL